MGSESLSLKSQRTITAQNHLRLLHDEKNIGVNVSGNESLKMVQFKLNDLVLNYCNFNFVSNIS